MYISKWTMTHSSCGALLLKKEKKTLRCYKYDDSQQVGYNKKAIVRFP